MCGRCVWERLLLLLLLLTATVFGFGNKVTRKYIGSQLVLLVVLCLV